MRFDKFTQKAQQAIAQAQAEAQSRNHSQIDPEHLLLALLQQSDGVVPQIAQKIGARPETLIAETDQGLQNKPQAYGSTAQVGVSRELSNVLNKAQSEANALRDDYVSTEHLLLALVGDRKGS